MYLSMADGEAKEERGGFTSVFGRGEEEEV
jgi:hypothetical protein